MQRAERSVGLTSQECELCARFPDRLGRIICQFLQKRYVSGMLLRWKTAARQHVPKQYPQIPDRNDG